MLKTKVRKLSCESQHAGWAGGQTILSKVDASKTLLLQYALVRNTSVGINSLSFSLLFRDIPQSNLTLIPLLLPFQVS